MSTGLAEFKMFAATYHMKVDYILNINDSPTEVLDLFSTWGNLPPANGTPIQYVELGNEDYAYDGGAGGATRYRAQVLPLIRALRQTHPDVMIGAQLAGHSDTGWNKVVLGGLRSSVDFWILHRYVPYAQYNGAGSYSETLDSLWSLHRELVQLDGLRSEDRPELWLTEYNLSFYDHGHYSNIRLLPRYYLLLATYLYLAVDDGVDGMFKWCLANPAWQGFADIDYAGSVKADLSLGGQVSAFLNHWVTNQDSIWARPLDKSSKAQSLLLAGKDLHRRISFLVQNLDSINTIVNLQVPRGYVWLSSDGRFEYGTALGIDRPPVVPRSFGYAVQVPPYSVTAIDFAPAAH